MSKIVGALLIFFLTTWVFQLLAVTAGYGEGYKYLFVFFAPEVNPDTLANVTRSYELNSTAMVLEVDREAPLEYYMYWLLTGSKPSNLNVSLVNAYVDYDRTAYLWQDVALIDIPLVDPYVHQYAINPLVNILVSHIPPAILRVPINGSMTWSELGTVVTSTVIGDRLELKLVELNVSLSLENVTEDRLLGPWLVNVTKPRDIGDCYISFYVVGVGKDYVELFFPGAFRRSGYASAEIAQALGVISHWYFVLAYLDFARTLPGEVLEWWLNETTYTSREYLVRTVASANTSIYFMYLPHVAIAKKILSGDSLSRYEYRVLDLIVSSLATFVKPRKPDYLAVFLTTHGGEAYVVLAGDKVAAPLIGDVALTLSQFMGLLLSYSNGFPIRHADLYTLNQRVDTLENEVSSLKSTVEELNAALNNTRSELAICKTESELLRAKILEVESLYKDAENLKKTAYLYLTSGFLASIGISVLLGFLAYKVLAKKKAS